MSDGQARFAVPGDARQEPGASIDHLLDRAVGVPSGTVTFLFTDTGVQWLAVDGRDGDGAERRMRLGPNSSQVIVTEIGSDGLGYTAVAEQVIA